MQWLKIWFDKSINIWSVNVQDIKENIQQKSIYFVENVVMFFESLIIQESRIVMEFYGKLIL